MKNSHFWFSIVEIIITVAILIILSVVAVTSYQSVIDKSDNSLVESHLQTLNNTFLTYSSDTKTLPYPSGNLKFYNVDGAYEHSYEDENTFWVSWYITNDFIPKSYLQNIPIDPRNNQYYWYAQVKGNLAFQISGVVVNNHEPKSKLISNWKGLSSENKIYMPYLVKEYNGPRFITQDSIENFPYNPEERILTAKIHKMNWNVSINQKNVSQDEALNYILWEWDTVSVSQWWYVDIYYSDGSYSSLWDTSEASQIVFTQMRYFDETNLFTNIKIGLNAWSLWTKAAKLADKSEFQIETPAAVAAVRWTIFWMRKSTNVTSIVLKEWKIEVLLKQSGTLVPLEQAGVAQWGFMEVEKWEPELGVDILENAWTPSSTSSTGSILKIPSQKSQEFLQYIPPSQVEIKILDEIICGVWFEKLNWECVEFEQNETSSGAILFYQNLLKRNPTKSEVESFESDTSNGKLYTKIDAYHRYVNAKEKYFNPEYICEAQRSFKNEFRCVDNLLFKDDKDWKVVAFAPFDRDLSMVLTWSTLSAANYWYLHEPLYKKYSSGANIFLDNQSWDSDFKLSWIPSSIEGNTFKMLPGINIYKWGRESWIFIDNYNPGSSQQDFIKYDISSLVLWNTFAIEMSVRWAALKRTVTSNPYRIFSIDTNIFLQKENLVWGYQLNFQSWINNTYKIDQSNIQWLKDNEFYKVIASYDNNTSKAWLKIFDSNNKEIISTLPGESPNVSLPLSYLYIWSTGVTPYVNQWNDIIDYVKIYTK